MFENFEPKGTPDNRFVYLETEEQDDIIIGASCKHVFIIPKVYASDTIQDIVIFYRQGLYTLIEKHKDNDDVIITPINDECAKVEIELKPWDTVLFRKNGLDTFVQLKIVVSDEDISYTKPRKLIIRQPLDQGV